MSGTILIAGCGYRGKRLAQRLIAHGYSVRGLTRSAEHAAAFEKLGIVPFIGDVTKPDSLRGMGEGVTAVYHLMGSMNGSDEQLQALHVDGTRNLLTELSRTPGLPKISRYIYESSTAVYGQIDGEWVDETAPRTPSSKMGKLRVAAEDILLNAYREHGLPLIILRPSSIYRPEGVINRKIREGTYSLTSDPEKLMNHIYIEDFLDVMAAALTRGTPGEAYNVSDDEPKRGIDYVSHIAELMGAPQPRVDFNPPPGGCTDLIRASNKRCSNQKLKRDFGLALRFPTYREGLRESARLGWTES
ncbi:MAG TPA: NAD-dependent epimerase/dehydratase family protein [Planctomycetota bacterium]|nr:NAD-dependent epimerase/dehydratase family protein [Planctomycetota bacterium]